MTLSREANDFAHMNAPTARMGQASYYRRENDTTKNRSCAHQQFDAGAIRQTRGGA